MSRRLTPAEARAFVQRSRKVNAAERAELRATPVAGKLRQLAALMASVEQLGWSEALVLPSVITETGLDIHRYICSAWLAVAATPPQAAPSSR